jgi:hypothetical protein
MEDTNWLLGIIQLIHFLIDSFNMSYIFIFSAIYDIYFVSWILLQTIHWGLLKNECIVSYIEKKLINPQYTLGENPKWIPHYDVYYNKFTITLKSILILGGLLFIIIRSKTKNTRIICGMAILLWVYFTYLYKKPQL